MQEGSTEYAIFICFELGMFAKNPLELDRFLGNEELPFPISFFYGDIDWMDKKGGERVVNKNKFGGSQSHVYVVTNSDHHMYLDNPTEFATLIIEDVKKSEHFHHQVVTVQFGEDRDDLVKKEAEEDQAVAAVDIHIIKTEHGVIVREE